MYFISEVNSFSFPFEACRDNNIINTGLMGLGQYNSPEEYCGPQTASEVFLTFTPILYQYFSVFCIFPIFSDEPEVFLPKYSKTAKLHAAHFRKVVI